MRRRDEQTGPARPPPSPVSGDGPPATPPTWRDAWQTVSWADFTHVHTYPGVREGLLVGMAAGFGAGGLRYAFARSRSVAVACNWAVGAFCLGAVAEFERGRLRKRKERTAMKRVVEVMDRRREGEQEREREKFK